MIRVSTLAVAVMVIASPVSAQSQMSQADKQAVRAACGQEMRAVCPSYVSPNASLQDSIKACMKDNIQSFSRQCKKALVMARIHQQ